MTPDLIIGVDAGTSVIKSVAFSSRGEQVAVHAVANRYERVAGGGAEQAMARTWTDTAQTLRGLAEQIPNLARRIMAIAVTGQGDGTWLIDAAGEPVIPAFLWLDARAAGIIEILRADPRSRAQYSITGTGLAACQQSGQLLWLMRHRPQALARAATAFHCKDWLYFKLTGVRATDPAEGTFTFGDFRTRQYSSEVLDILGLTNVRHLLPPMLDGTIHSDPMAAEAADLTHLLAGTPVVLGYLDVPCTALGAGVVDREGTTGCTIIGSTGMHIRLARSANEVVLNADCTGYTMPLPRPGTYAQMQSNLAATLNIDWLVDRAVEILMTADVQRSRSQFLEKLDAQVLVAAPGQILFHPYISEAGERGPFIDATARASFIGLASRHTYADLMRSLYEGLAFAARDCYATMGGPPDEICLTGGASRSRAIRQIMAAALGAKVRTSAREEAGAAGVAMMAAVCLGVYRDLDACAADWTSPLLGPLEEPDRRLADIYSKAFPVYLKTRHALAPIWHDMAQQSGTTG
jgi:erythritol kinase (D-erythritol 1-phosphate-forming)